MSKIWTCDDCVKQGTDACYFREVNNGHLYCKAVLVDADYAYNRGRADAIDEYANKLRDFCTETVNECSFLECPFCRLGCKITSIAEQLKEEQNNDIR